MKPLATVSEEVGKRLPGAADEPLRLFHGRGQTIPGFEFLTIDWYPPIALVTLYEERNNAWLHRLRTHLTTVLGDRLQGIAVQNRDKASPGSSVIFGTVPDRLTITESGLSYVVEPLARQNTGFFLDMKTGRQLVREIARNKRVLNLFAYTCAFSVAAVAGGARRVVNLDMNRNLLEKGKANHLGNGHDLRDIAFLPHNLFKSFGRLKQEGPFDLAIIDPPGDQAGSFKAERDWPKIVKRLPELLTPGGEIIAAVSAPELGRAFLRRQFSEHLPAAELLTELTAGESFPEAEPDKGLHLQHYRWQTA